MKRFVPIIAILCVLLLGIGVTAYPLISNYLYDKNKSQVLTDYKGASSDLSFEETDRMIREVEKYNASLLSARAVLTDPFDPTAVKPGGEARYKTLLNVHKDGIMGYVEIPVIDLTLPVYHGTSPDILEQGIGHLENTSLPIGGKSTHAVLTGHTGLAGKKMFTDLSQLRRGDVFYIHVLGKVLAYQTERRIIAEPKDTSSLAIVPGKDMVTLFTCYPYGINSHRLLVQGERIPYKAAVAAQKEQNRDAGSPWKNEYKKAVGLCLAIYIPLTLIILLILRIKRR